MRLGRDTGSVINHLISGTNGQPTPEVGMGVTVLMWTDRHAGTITRVDPKGRKFWFREDTAIRTDSYGMSDCQSYRYEPNPSAPEELAVLKKNGAWRTGRGQMRLGDRRAYHDFSF